MMAKKEYKEYYDWFYEGYMAGMMDSEDYDHNPQVMVKEAWIDLLEELADETE